MSFWELVLGYWLVRSLQRKRSPLCIRLRHLDPSAVDRVLAVEQPSANENIMNDDQFLEIYGIAPAHNQLDEVRNVLREQIQMESTAPGSADFEVLRLCVVALFNTAELRDVALIWKAKQSSMDASAGLEVHLLCGAGLPTTKSYLKEISDEECASDILGYIEHCEQNGDFNGFDVASFRRDLAAYYSE